MSTLLQTKGLTKNFGGLAANTNIQLSVEVGQIVGLLGPNGAGKTTLFNCIAGYHKIDSGTILFNGKPIANLPPNEICTLGIARTFQLVKIFGDMSVLDNVMAGAFLRHKRAEDAKKKALEILEYMGMENKRDILCETLTLSDKKHVEIARALATEPSLLLLDEALAGLTGEEMQNSVAMIVSIAKTGIAILIVEHVMEVIMPISDKVIVLDHGEKIAEDEPMVVANNPSVIEAYLGKSYVAKS